MPKDEKYLLNVIERLQIRLAEEIETSVDYEALLIISDDINKTLKEEINKLQAKPKHDYNRITQEQQKSQQSYEKVIADLSEKINTMQVQHKHEIDHLNELIKQDTKGHVECNELKRQMETISKEKEELQTKLLDLTKANMELKGD